MPKPRSKTAAPARPYVYSAYWGTWSRCLGEDPETGEVLEVNLTPVNAGWSSSWDRDVKPVVLRLHCTARSRGDLQRERLPGEIVSLMLNHVGPGLTEYLLYADLLAEIDMDRLASAMRGGGVPLSACTK